MDRRQGRHSRDDRLQGQEVADLGVGQSQLLLAEDRYERIERAPRQRHADEGDRHRSEGWLPEQRPQWRTQGQSLA